MSSDPNTSATASPNLRVSVVIPVYSGQETLPSLMAELGNYTSPTKTAQGHTFTIEEVLLVGPRPPRQRPNNS